MTIKQLIFAIMVSFFVTMGLMNLVMNLVKG